MVALNLPLKAILHLELIVYVHWKVSVKKREMTFLFTDPLDPSVFPGRITVYAVHCMHERLSSLIGTYCEGCV